MLAPEAGIVTHLLKQDCGPDEQEHLKKTPEQERLDRQFSCGGSRRFPSKVMRADVVLAIPRGRLRMRGTGFSFSADEQGDQQSRKSAAIRAGVPSAIPATIPRPGMDYFNDLRSPGNRKEPDSWP